MKYFISLVGLFLSFNVMAEQIPFAPELDLALTPLVSNTNNQVLKRVARAVWNPTANSAEGSSTTDSGVHGMGVTLPAKSIITDAFGYVVTQPTDANRLSRVGFQCEDANNILAQTDLTQKVAGEMFQTKLYGGSSLPGASSAPAGMVAGIASACTVQSKVTVGDYTGGKVILFIEYLVGE